MGYSLDKEYANSYVASDTLLQSNDANASPGSAVYVKVKTIMVITDVYPRSQLRICWTQASGGAGTTTSKLKKSGVDLAGTESAGVNTFSFDISFTDLKYSDILELWSKNDQNLGSVTNYRVKGTVTPFVNV